MIVRFFRRRKKQGAYANPRHWWDKVYDAMHPHSASGHIGLTVEQNLAEFEVRWDVVGGAVERFRSADHHTLLDAGCGNGLFTSRFLEMGFAVTGFDFSSRAIAAARRHVGPEVELHVAGVDTFSVDRTFDFVVSSAVMMVITDDVVHADGLRNLAGMVSPGGHLIIEEYLVPHHEVSSGPPTASEIVRWRSLATYEELLAESPLELADKVDFTTPHGQQDRCVLVYARPRVG
jgi:SAM-dependent methyltransferase